MKNLTKTLFTAAATAASTALVATTVAIETATAAIFTGEDTRGIQVTIEYDDSNGVSFDSSSLDSWSSVLVEDSQWTFSPGLPDKWIGDDIGDLIFDIGTGLGLFIDSEGIEIKRSDFVRSVTQTPGEPDTGAPQPVPEPSGVLALGVLGVGAVASRLRRRS